MTARPTILEAAGQWLATPESDSAPAAAVRSALTDLVTGRYHGHAGSLRRIHELRQSLLDDPRPLSAVSAVANPGPWDDQTVGRAAEHSAPPEQGRLLFHLTRASRPEVAVEVGTNIGISGAYIAAGLEVNSTGRLSSLEASGLRLTLARQVLTELGLERVDLVEGYFDETLEPLLARLGPVDLAFVDGNHTFEATVRYFGRLADHARPGSLLVFDDIRWSEGMAEAWATISVSPRIQLAIDLSRTGLVVIG